MEMNRRSFMTSMVATVALPAVSSAASSVLRQSDVKPVSNGTNRRPKNVVVMIADDLGYGDLGCYGSTIPTPNIDKMAAAGVRFTHFNAAHPICSASRAALLTGRYAQRSHTVGAFFPHAKEGMSLGETTIANMFHQKGYRTKAIGKWHLGDAAEYLPTRRGFDSYYGVPYSDDMAPLPLIRDTKVLEAETDRDLLTSRYTEDAIRFLNEDSSHPFFLYMAYSYPHDPARASAPFRGQSGLGDYGDAVHEIDWSVGEVLRVLEKRKMLADTLVIFTSDHGPWYQGSPANLRGRKCSTFEGGFRVPFIAHWPSAITPGTTSNSWASNLDIMPTMMELCDLGTPPNPLDGISISELLLGEEKTSKRQSLLYFTPFSSGGTDLHCARQGDWKLRFAQLNGEIYINDYTAGHQSFWLPHPELYNLSLDPTESYDVAKQHPEIVQEILEDVRSQLPTLPDNVRDAFSQLQKNVARITTPPGAAPRPPSNAPLPAWAWEPGDRR
jgi:arylsulfatase A